MKIVSTGYVNTPAFSDPGQWLERISFYTGILEELAKKNEVESIEQINYSGRTERNGVRYHFLNFRNAGSYFPWRQHQYIKKLKPAVVLVNGFIFPLQIMQLRFLLGNKVKIAVINRAEKPGIGKRKFLQRLADRCVQRYFFTSEEMGADWVQHGIIANKNKVAAVMQASSPFFVMKKEEARKKTGITGAPVFLFVGRLDANKDPVNILKAFGVFIKQQPLAKLYMIYQADELKPEIGKLIESNPDLQNAVEMVGEVPNKEMQYWYNSADFIISGSHYEGSGIAVCEAMSCACIPILTSIPSFRKMTGPGNCGLLYEPGNAGALLKALLKTTELDMEKEKANALQQFEQELSFKAIAEKIEHTLASL